VKEKPLNHAFCAIKNTIAPTYNNVEQASKQKLRPPILGTVLRLNKQTNSKEAST